MRLLAREREFAADLKGLRLEDVFKQMQEENFFTKENRFSLSEQVNENHLVFEVPRDKVTPRQVHYVKYSEAEGKMIFGSSYSHWFFPSFLAYILPLIPIVLSVSELELRQIKLLLLMMLGITVFIAAFAFSVLGESSKYIERELVIRANSLLRKQGYRTGI